MRPDRDATGRWFGACESGLAAGTGYGLVIDDEGDVLEYVGAAQSGMAEGLGAMILNAPGETGAVFFEGEFRSGLPDGVVRVEEPGRKSRVRMFRAGQDAGAASIEDLQRIQF